MIFLIKTTIIMSLLHEELTGQIIKAFYAVYNKLGYGFPEKVYENAMLIELRKMDFYAINQAPIKVYYDEELVGEYFADIIVEEEVIIELKAASKVAVKHEVQLMNYLKATHVEVGLLMNFGEKPEIKRKIFTNDMK